MASTSVLSDSAAESESKNSIAMMNAFALMRAGRKVMESGMRKGRQEHSRYVDTCRLDHTVAGGPTSQQTIKYFQLS